MNRQTTSGTPLARVGMTEREAAAAGHAVHVKTVRGFLRAVLDKDSNLLLGVDILCEEALSLVGTAKLAIDARIPAQALKGTLFANPLATKTFHVLFS